MVNYKLKILRNGEPVANYNAAINALNEFEGHYVGQPIAIVYLDNSERKLLLAMGKRDHENDQIDGRNHGPEFYEIINDIKEFFFRYESSYPLSTRTTSTVGGIEEGVTLASILNETNNGDMSRLIDLVLFGSAVIHPQVIDPSIVNFSLNGQEEVTVHTAPSLNDFYIETDRGFVSYGKNSEEEIVTDVEFAGIATSYIQILDRDGQMLLDDPTVGDYIYRLFVQFAAGDVTPLNSDGTVFSPPYDGERVYTKDVLVHIVQPIYVGIVDIDSYLHTVEESMSLEESLEYYIEEGLIIPFNSSDIYKLYGNDKWGVIVILSPGGCSCKYQGDTERIQTFSSEEDAITIDGLSYNEYVSISDCYDFDPIQMCDNMTFYSSDPSYYYEITCDND